MYSSVEDVIRSSIQEQGQITFAEFMEKALYGPGGGYYTKASSIGTSGDYYTSPSTHPIFGGLISVQLFQMWQLMGRPKPFTIVEVGSGNGLLKRDLTQYLQYLPEGFSNNVEYVCIDKSEQSKIERNTHRKSISYSDIAEYQGLGIEGCVLSNELIDSFPVHRVQMKKGVLQELYVTLRDGVFVEKGGVLSTQELNAHFDQPGIKLNEGHVFEVNLNVCRWIKDVSRILKRGYIITVDYGGVAGEIYSESKSQGTLTCFYRHVQTNNPYLHIGNQDITSQVNYTMLTKCGLGQGFVNKGYLSQREFLTNLGLPYFLRLLQAMDIDSHTKLANRFSMLDLVSAEGFGDFKVLIQGKNVSNAALWCRQLGFEEMPVLKELPIPMLTESHMPLLEGKYPHVRLELPDTWM